MFLLLFNVNGGGKKHVTYHSLYSSRIRYWLLMCLSSHRSKLIGRISVMVYPTLLREAALRRGGRVILVTMESIISINRA